MSNKPLGTVPDSPRSTLPPCTSAGTLEHELTPWSCRHDVFWYLEFNYRTFVDPYRNFQPVLSLRRPIEMTGLKNLGNTCFMNSVIQCMFNCKVFRDYLTKDTYLKHINRYESISNSTQFSNRIILMLLQINSHRTSGTHGMITDELACLFKELLSKRYKSISPLDFFTAFGRANRKFAGHQQQDAHEFFIILLDILHSELKFPTKNVRLSCSLLLSFFNIFNTFSNYTHRWWV